MRSKNALRQCKAILEASPAHDEGSACCRVGTIALCQSKQVPMRSKMSALGGGFVIVWSYASLDIIDAISRRISLCVRMRTNRETVVCSRRQCVDAWSQELCYLTRPSTRPHIRNAAYCQIGPCSPVYCPSSHRLGVVQRSRSVAKHVRAMDKN